MNVSLSIAKKFRTFILVLFLAGFQFSIQASSLLPALTLTQRQICDLELLLNGGFYPLDGFMDSQTYESVVHKMRLPNGTLWPMPIVLDAREEDLSKLGAAEKIALKDHEGFILAYLTVSEIWKPNKMLEAEMVYETTSLEHPGVDYLLRKMGDYYIGGKLKKLQCPDIMILHLFAKLLKS